MEEVQRQHAELQYKFNEIKTQNDKEQERFIQDQYEVKNIRKKKQELTRKKELSEKECKKLSNELQ